MTETKNEPARDDMERVTAWRGIAQAWEALGDLAGPGFRALVEIDGSGRVGAEIQLRQEHGDGWDTIAEGEGENIEEAVAALEESNASSPTPPSSPSSRAPATEGERRVHDVKCWPEPFAALRRDEKPYEIRVNDRDYHVGDVLRLHEFDPAGCPTRDLTTGAVLACGSYTGEEEERVVTYMTPGGEWGLPEHLCVLGLARLASRAPAEDRGARERLARACRSRDSQLVRGRGPAECNSRRRRP
jgi:hypothetical protein